jgi:hypothetical protein
MTDGTTEETLADLEPARIFDAYEARDDVSAPGTQWLRSVPHDGVIADLTEQSTEYQDKLGAVLSNLVGRVQAECGITRQEVYKVIDLLEAKGAIMWGTTGIIQLAGESQ